MVEYRFMSPFNFDNEMVSMLGKIDIQKIFSKESAITIAKLFLT